MRLIQRQLWLFVAVVVAASWVPSSARAVAQAGQGPAMASIGPLAFGPDGTLYISDERNRGDARVTAYARLAAERTGSR